jgi:hypothetical protein
MWTTVGQKGFGKRSGSKVTHDVEIYMSVKWTTWTPQMCSGSGDSDKDQQVVVTQYYKFKLL